MIKHHDDHDDHDDHGHQETTQTLPKDHPKASSSSSSSSSSRRPPKPPGGRASCTKATSLPFVKPESPTQRVSHRVAEERKRGIFFSFVASCEVKTWRWSRCQEALREVAQSSTLRETQTPSLGDMIMEGTAEDGSLSMPLPAYVEPCTHAVRHSPDGFGPGQGRLAVGAAACASAEDLRERQTRERARERE